MLNQNHSKQFGLLGTDVPQFKERDLTVLQTKEMFI